MRHTVLRFRAGLSDYSDILYITNDGKYSVYGDVKKEFSKDAPEAPGMPMFLTHYVDAKLYHDVLTGNIVTCILYLINQTPILWEYKKQPIAETAKYSSKFVAARICVEKDIDMKTTLKDIGVPIIGPNQIFCDNASVANSSMNFHAKFQKQHDALVFH